MFYVYLLWISSSISSSLDASALIAGLSRNDCTLTGALPSYVLHIMRMSLPNLNARYFSSQEAYEDYCLGFGFSSQEEPVYQEPDENDYEYLQGSAC